VTALYHLALTIAAYVGGTIVGSFLNVCIYRIPREISLTHPARSFCPHCEQSIPWRQNIPVASWIFLRGRCSHCHAQIRITYPVVEMLSGLLYALSAWLIPFPETMAIWVLVAFLIVATFVDIDFFIIPNSVSKGGIAAGLLLSILLPQLHGTSSNWIALGASAIGGATGIAILYGVGELGKLAFGRFKIRHKQPVTFSFENVESDDARIIVDNQEFYWSEHFFRKSDRAKIRAATVEIEGTNYRDVELIFFYDRLTMGQLTFPLDHLRGVRGETTEAEFPREAMGLGDVKLVGAIGTFIGWQGVLFTIPAAALVGAIYGLIASAAGKREWTSKIPFGPYLAAGALLWVFAGHQILAWYFGLLGV
jgi:leader peptidase (prepilin peptidase) / N-methyltransferase